MRTVAGKRQALRARACRNLLAAPAARERNDPLRTGLKGGKERRVARA